MSRKETDGSGWESDSSDLTTHRTRRSPPFGIQVIVILLGFFTLLNLVQSIGLMGLPGVFGIAGVGVFLLNLGVLVTLAGLYRLRWWGWAGFLLLTGLQLALVLLLLYPSTVSIVTTIIGGIIMVYVYSWRDLYR